MWECFDPLDGIAQCRTRSRIVARMVARLTGLDYAMTGEGWTA